MYDLLVEAFHAEKEARSLEFFHDGTGGIQPGHELRRALLKEVGESDLLIACFFKGWEQHDYFRHEIEAARAKGVPIISILFLGRKESAANFRLGDLHPSFEEEKSGRPVHVVVEIRCGIVSNAEAVRQAIREQVGSTLGGMLITRIRNQIIDRARRDLTMDDSVDQLLHDLAANSSSFIHMFMYDGGTTIGKFAQNQDIVRYLQQSAGLQLRFMYVDTDFEPSVREAPEFITVPGLKRIDKKLYAPLYEALIRRSGIAHNRSPNGHMADVARSVDMLRTLQKKNRLIGGAKDLPAALLSNGDNSSVRLLHGSGAYLHRG